MPPGTCCTTKRRTARRRHLRHRRTCIRTPGSAASIYVLVLMGVTAALSHGLVRLDAFDVGELDAARVQAGQWWRAWTALTLHVDGPHLAANLAAGVWFGYLAARQMGAGSAWLLTVTGAGIANLLEGLLGPADHISVGASTAVFACPRGDVGLFLARAPAAAAALGAALGAAGRGRDPAGLDRIGRRGHDDVIAHLAGFAVGAVLGATVALPPLQPYLRARAAVAEPAPRRSPAWRSPGGVRWRAEA